MNLGMEQNQEKTEKQAERLANCYYCGKALTKKTIKRKGEMAYCGSNCPALRRKRRKQVKLRKRKVKKWRRV